MRLSICLALFLSVLGPALAITSGQLWSIIPCCLMAGFTWGLFVAHSLERMIEKQEGR